MVIQTGIFNAARRPFARSNCEIRTLNTNLYKGYVSTMVTMITGQLIRSKY